jgi:hypothetical protein
MPQESKRNFIMGMVTKTAAEIIAIANSASENSNNRAGFDYADIDTQDMPELTADQAARMQPARIFDRLPEHLKTQIEAARQHA